MEVHGVFFWCWVLLLVKSLYFFSDAVSDFQGRVSFLVQLEFLCPFCCFYTIFNPLLYVPPCSQLALLEPPLIFPHCFFSLPESA